MLMAWEVVFEELRYGEVAAETSPKEGPKKAEKNVELVKRS